MTGYIQQNVLIQLNLPHARIIFLCMLRLLKNLCTLVLFAVKNRF